MCHKAKSHGHNHRRHAVVFVDLSPFLNLLYIEQCAYFLSFIRTECDDLLSKWRRNEDNTDILFYQNYMKISKNTIGSIYSKNAIGHNHGY